MRRPMALAALALALVSGPAAAQLRQAGPATRSSERHGEGNALRAQLGIPVAQRLLASEDLGARLRGIERLGAIGTTEAVDALVDAMDPQSVAARDVRARLVAVRVLAGEAKRDNVRQLLLREVTDTSGADGRSGALPLSAVRRQTAALALARSGDRKAVGALVNVLFQAGPVGEAAVRALRAYPPSSLEPFLEGRKRLTPGLATFLGELGDLRAIERLRAMVGESDPTGKMAAAVALARLGDEAALPVAREWLTKSEPRQRRAAAEVLVLLDAPEAPAAVAALLESDATRDEGLRLALAAPSPALAATLAKVLPGLPEEQRLHAVAALGRAGAVTQLVPLLDQADTALAAAFALATIPGAEARTALEHALAGETAKADEARRLLLRAGVVRALVLGDAPAGLHDGLRALFKGTAPADRAAGAFGLVALGKMSLGDALEASCQKGETLVCDAAATAAARGALALPDGASSLEPLLPLLERAAAAADPRLGGRPRGSTDAARDRARARCCSPTPTAATCPPRCSPPGPRRGARWRRSPRARSPAATTRRSAAASSACSKGAIPWSAPTSPSASPAIRSPRPCRSSPRPTASRTTRACAAPWCAPSHGGRRCSASPRWRSPAISTPTTRCARWPPPPWPGACSTPRSARRSASSPGARSPGSPSSPTTDPPRPSPRTARLVRADGLAVPAVADPDGALLVPGMPVGAASLHVGARRGGAEVPRVAGRPAPAAA